MLIYHGTQHRDIKQFRDMQIDRDYDFGRGVYFTSYIDQAKKLSCKHSYTGAVYECEIDLNEMRVLNLNKDKSLEDLHVVLYLCRIRLEEIVDDAISGFDNADCIYGYMLDGSVKGFREIAEKYNQGDITLEELIEKTKLYNANNSDQFCFKSRRALSLINDGLRKKYFTRKRGNNHVEIEKEIIIKDKLFCDGAATRCQN